MIIRLGPNMGPLAPTSRNLGAAKAADPRPPLHLCTIVSAARRKRPQRRCRQRACAALILLFRRALAWVCFLLLVPPGLTANCVGGFCRRGSHAREDGYGQEGRYDGLHDHFPFSFLVCECASRTDPQRTCSCSRGCEKSAFFDWRKGKTITASRHNIPWFWMLLNQNATLSWSGLSRPSSHRPARALAEKWILGTSPRMTTSSGVQSESERL